MINLNQRSRLIIFFLVFYSTIDFIFIAQRFFSYLCNCTWSFYSFLSGNISCVFLFTLVTSYKNVMLKEFRIFLRTNLSNRILFFVKSDSFLLILKLFSLLLHNWMSVIKKISIQKLNSFSKILRVNNFLFWLSEFIYLNAQHSSNHWSI